MIPTFVQECYVVILCCKNRVLTHYGLRAIPYVEGEEKTWETRDTDFLALKRYCDIVRSLIIRYEVQPLLTVFGNSAGGDTALSYVAYSNDFLSDIMVRVAFLVIIATAYHPTLYDLAFPVLVSHDTYVIVLQHAHDEYCPWRHVENLWTKFADVLRKEKKGALY